MAKLHENYETIMILNTKATEEETKALVEKFTGMIAKNGTIETVEEWGKRKLAYEIADEAEGYYVFTTFTAEPEFPAELNRVAGITDGVLRVMVIKK